MLGRTHPDVVEYENEILLQLVTEFKDALFSLLEDGIGHTSLVKHEINTRPPGVARPVSGLNSSPTHQAAIDSHIQTMLRQKIIAAAQSPRRANVVMVTKRSGTFDFVYIFAI